MADPRARSIRAAEVTTRELKKLFAKLGTKEHPRGQILAAYRNAHRGLRSALKQNVNNALFGTTEVLSGLRRDVRGTMREALEDSVALGLSQAEVEALAWGLERAGTPPNVSVVEAAWIAGVDTQINASLAVVAAGGDTSLIVGDDARAGILRPDSIIGEGARWLATTAVLAHTLSLKQSAQASGTEWGKQAVPAIDKNTTDCCLRVAGQVVPFKGKFALSGTPRFADKMDWSPFHWYCRTSIVMVPLSQADDDMTRRLLTTARREIGQRDEARQRALELMERLGKLGAAPDGRRRGDDNKEIIRLRRELVKAKVRAHYYQEE